MATCTTIKFVKYGCRVIFYEMDGSDILRTIADMPLNADFQIVQQDGGGLLFIFDGTKISLEYEQINEFVERNTVNDIETPIGSITDEDSFILYLEQERNTCSEVQVNVPGLSPPTAASVAPNDTSTTAAGNTTANALEVSFTNIGPNEGTWNGIVVPVGYSRTYQATLDPVNEVFYRIASMAYDPTTGGGTTFIISEIL